MLSTIVNVTHDANTNLTGFSEESSDKDPGHKNSDHDSDGEPLSNWLMVKRVHPKRSNKVHKRQKK